MTPLALSVIVSGEHAIHNHNPPEETMAELKQLDAKHRDEIMSLMNKVQESDKNNRDKQSQIEELTTDLESKEKELFTAKKNFEKGTASLRKELEDQIQE